MRKFFFDMAALLIVFLFFSDAYAKIPHYLSYRGYVTDSDGVPAKGKINVNFKIYDSIEDSAAALWEEQHFDIAVENGYFSILLGKDPLNSFPEGMFQNPLYLGISVDEGSELKPRQEIVSMPFAFTSDFTLSAGTCEMAKDSEKLGGKTFDQLINKNLTCNECVDPTEVSFYYAGSSTKGGTAFNSDKLDGHDSSDFASVNHAHTGEQVTSAVAEAKLAQDLQCSGCVNFTDLDSAGIYIETDKRYVNIDGDTMTGKLILQADGLAVGANQLILSSGNTGIGTIAPLAKLEVAGNVKATSFEGLGTGLVNVNAVDADSVDGFHASGTPVPGKLLALDANGLLATGVTGNAGTVTNGLYSTGNYANPSWISSLAGAKITGNISGNAANVTGIVSIEHGGTGASSANVARTNLGLGSLATLNSVSGSNITDGSITNADLAAGSFNNITGVGTLGNLNVSNTITTSWLTINKPAGNDVVLSFQQGGTPRFAVHTNSAGDKLHFSRYDDSGNYVDAPITILRGSGNVGIGTTDPNEKLTLGSGAIGFAGAAGGPPNNAGNSAGYKIKLYNVPNEVYGIGLDSATVWFSLGGGGGAAFKWYKGGTEWMRLSGGNLGIGTTNPSQKLEINGYSLNYHSETNWIATFAGYSGNGFVFDDNSNLLIGTWTQIKPPGSWSEKMRITGSGNVGIGTTTPASLLHVAGNVEAQGFTINGYPLGTSTDSYWLTTGTDIYYNLGNVGIGTDSPSEALEIQGNLKVSGEISGSHGQKGCSWVASSGSSTVICPEGYYSAGTDVQITGNNALQIKIYCCQF